MPNGWRGMYRWGSLAITVFLDAAATSAALALALAARHGARIPHETLALARVWLPTLVAARIIGLAVFTRYRPAWRYTGIADLRGVFQAVTAGTVAIGFLQVIRPVAGLPGGVLLLEWLLSLNLLMAVRLSARLPRRWWLARRSRLCGERARPVLIVGACDTGAIIARSLLDDPAERLRPIGFVDDDPATWRNSIHGLPILGSTSGIADVIRRHAVDQILITLPSLPDAEMCRIIRACSETGATPAVVPAVSQAFNRNGARSTCNVRIEDLLDRAPTEMDLASCAETIAGEVVLVTGAGGSIGSELCRQLVQFGPRRLIVLGHGEHSVFWIEHDLRTRYGYQSIPIIADIKDRERMDRLFSEYHPTVIFHAAAHKHVPLMERNPEEAVKNNIFGTRNLAELALEHGVRRFVMISTDKTVNPKSVMGASKRVAEMIVQSLAQRIEAARSGDTTPFIWEYQRRPEDAVTCFGVVRLGNVLGSRGSVIPTMQAQIAQGGPVTVTHPEMKRYFMTVTEVVQLVIRAGAMARHGEIFLHEMGVPVRIMNVARNLIRLSGYTPDHDIPIVVTGVRPGEKLVEDILTMEEGATVTTNERIYQAQPTPIDHARLYEGLELLARALHSGSGQQIKQLLNWLVPTYCPGSDIEWDEGAPNMNGATPAPDPVPLAAEGTGRTVPAP